MNDLFSLGFGPFFNDQLSEIESQGLVPARVAAEHRGQFELWTADAQGPGVLSGRLRNQSEAYPGVGDWVGVKEPPGAHTTAVVDHLFRRRTLFTRGAAGQESRTQVIAANVDVVFVVCGLDGDYNLHRIERYLTRIAASGADAEIILNKVDLCGDTRFRVREVERRCPGIPVHPMSALLSDGVRSLQTALQEGITGALVGSSGAGKSTLVNSLVGEAVMATGHVSTGNARGRHVTTHRQLVRLPSGGLLLDTPGMRELQLPSEEGLNEVFDDIANLASGCRFRDCGHDSEPGCAVLAAVESGALSPDRLAHFRQLQREARSYELRHNEHLRRQSERVWGQLYEEVERLRKWKGQD